VPRPKQHHYVTKAYLDGFLAPSDEHRFCYGRNRSPFKHSPDALAKQRNYYSVKNADGTWDDSLESMIERFIEVPGLAVIKKLSSGKTRLKWDERQAISLFVAFQEMRTPAARQRARVLSKTFNDRLLHDIRAANPEQTSIGLIGRTGKANNVTLDEIVSSHDVLCDDHAMEIHKSLLGIAFRLCEVYQHMRFTVFYSMGDVGFITTDTPVIRVFYGDSRMGAGSLCAINHV
jgi:hypothetical protein